MVAVQSGATSADIQFQSLLQEYPALATAHHVVRSSRPPQYFKVTNQIFEQWVKPLGLDWIPETVIVLNLIVSIDTLFEACQTSREVQIIADELSGMTRLNTAMLYLHTLPENMEMTLEVSVKIHLAFVTAAGHKKLQVFFGDETADSWLEIWQRLVRSFNKQQREFSIETLQPESYKSGSSANLSRLVQTYLSQYEKTNGLSMIIMGMVPFSRVASINLFSALVELTDELEPLLRLVTDACVDTSEALNLGIFIVANEKNVSIAQARQFLVENPREMSLVEDQLRKEQQVYLTKARSVISSILKKYSEPTVNTILTEFSQVLLAVAQKLSADCKSFHDIEA